MTDVVTADWVGYSERTRYGLLMNAPCDGRQANLFYHQDFSGGTYTIMSSLGRHLGSYEDGVYNYFYTNVCARPTPPGGDNADIELVPCDDTDPLQHWRTRPGHDHAFQSGAYDESNTCIDGYAGGDNTIFTYTCDGSREQDWI